MKKNLKVLLDVEVVNDETTFKMNNVFGRQAYSYQLCGGGGCGCGGGKCFMKAEEKPVRSNINY